MAMKALLYQGRRHCDNSGGFDLTMKTGAYMKDSLRF
jgi:hypothetical protein